MDLKRIKKIYGEEMMHLCRELFPTILEVEGLLSSLLEKAIAPTKSLAKDIKENNCEEEFKDYIYSFLDVEKEIVTTSKTPFELLKEKGYTLYECKSEEEIQSFRKYYKKGEELCTFTFGNRLNRCYVFFAVKDNVSEIKRDSFKNPKRQDKYGTSVISIQFKRGENNTVSIKNRYNHIVNNPDATFSNNLENIVPGLTDSFERCFGFKINQNQNDYADFLLDINYVRGSDGKYYRANYEMNGIYYCENNIIIDNGQVIDKYHNEKERYIVIDYFVVDKKEKKVFLYNDVIRDSFTDSINNLGEIKNIISTSDKKIIIEYIDGKEVVIEYDEHNVITGYQNNYIENIGDSFLWNNEKLKRLELSNVKKISDWFLSHNTELNYLELPNVLELGMCFLNDNRVLSKIQLPKAKRLGSFFLFNNINLKELLIPNAEFIDHDSLYFNTEITSINFPKVTYIGGYFLHDNEIVKEVILPNVKEIGDGFLFSNTELELIDVSELKSTGIYFICNNTKLKIIDVPNMRVRNYGFLKNNKNVIINDMKDEYEKGNYKTN